MNKSPENRETLNCFFDKHYRGYATIHKKSFYHDEVTYNRHLRNDLGTKKMHSIGLKDIEEWIMVQKKVGYKNTTINKHVCNMGNFPFSN